ncbi:MAPEG family protein [Ectothiorhodospiraceae bacterium WFHF3C12]|nr:MAPEG family protein [Ectothiorhodospiraceae bacterium WFHF3C12]
MTATATALIGFILWYLLLYVMLGGLRVGYALAGKKKPNSFAPDGSDVSPFAHRLARAHANCYEGFPFIGGLMLLALVTGTAGITAPLAFVVLGARIVQSSIHLISTSVLAVQVRFLFLLVQLGIGAYWAVLLALDLSG